MTDALRSRPQDPRTRLARLPAPRHWVLVAVAGTVLTLALGFAVKLTPGVLPLELRLDEELTDHQHALLDRIGVGLSTLLSPVGACVVLALSFVFLLVVRRAPVNAFAFTGVAAFGWLSSEFFKIVVGEPRPDGTLLDHPLLAETGSSSFPSGHTAFVASYAIACWLLARGTRGMLPICLGGALSVAAMGAARLYVSGHYFTDIVGSVLVAGTAAVLFAGLWNRFGLPLLTRLPFVRAFGPVPAVAMTASVTEGPGRTLRS